MAVLQSRRLGVERLAVRRQANAASGALEELGAHGALQGSHLRRQGGLAQAAEARGDGEAAGGGYTVKGEDMIEIHGGCPTFSR